MADRLTQLQDLVSELAEQMCNSVGELQRSKLIFTFAEFDSLPIDEPTGSNADCGTELVRMGEHRARTVRELESVVSEGVELVVQIQEKLVHIARVQLESRPSV